MEGIFTGPSLSVQQKVQEQVGRQRMLAHHSHQDTSLDVVISGIMKSDENISYHMHSLFKILYVSNLFLKVFCMNTPPKINIFLFQGVYSQVPC